MKTHTNKVLLDIQDEAGATNDQAKWSKSKTLLTQTWTLESITIRKSSNVRCSMEIHRLNCSEHGTAQNTDDVADNPNLICPSHLLSRFVSFLVTFADCNPRPLTQFSAMMANTWIYQVLCDDGWYINISSSLWWWLIHQYTKFSMMMVDTSIYQVLCDDDWYINIPSSLWWWLINQYTKFSVMMADTSTYQALCNDGWYINITSSLWWWSIHQYTKFSVMMVDISIHEVLCNDNKNNCYIALYHVTIY